MSALLVVPASLLLAVVAWYLYWRYHAGKLQTSGHIVPDTSAFAKLMYLGASKLVGFLTIGPIKVVGKHNAPRKGRVVVVANHQIPADFAMVRSATGRHFRALGDAAQFTGFFGVLAAWIGIVTVTFKSKAERAAGQSASVKVLAMRRCGLRLGTAFAGWLGVIGFGLATLLFCIGSELLALASFFAGCLALSLPGGDIAFAIAPQGALMPDNQLKKEEFRAGAIRVAREAAQESGEPVSILPLALYYKRNPKDAHWSQRFLNCTRSKFLSMRNPRHWDPLFKLDLDALSPSEREDVVARRKAALAAYNHSQFTIYGGVVVVGEAIELSSLPENELEAIDVVRLKIAELLKVAERY